MSASAVEGFNGFPVPIGSILMWANDSSKPELQENLETSSGWLVCDGRQLLIADYPDLYRVLNNGATYDALAPTPPDAGKFYLPNILNPDYLGGYRGMLIGGTSAGTLVPAGSQVPIADAAITLTPQMLPSFSLDYDAASPYTCAGTYYCAARDGSKVQTNVYTNSNSISRNPTGDLFLREDVGYSSNGGLGNDSIAPIVRTTGDNTPLNIAASIVQNTFTPPFFEIVGIIRALYSPNFEKG